MEKNMPTVIIPIPVLYDPRLTHPERIVYAVLVRYAAQDKYCCLSIEKIATEIGVSRRQIHLYLKALKKAGLISTQKQTGYANIYTIIDPVKIYCGKDGQLYPEVLARLYKKTKAVTIQQPSSLDSKRELRQWDETKLQPEQVAPKQNKERQENKPQPKPKQGVRQWAEE